MLPWDNNRRKHILVIAFPAFQPDIKQISPYSTKVKLVTDAFQKANPVVLEA